MIAVTHAARANFMIFSLFSLLVRRLNSAKAVLVLDQKLKGFANQGPGSVGRHRRTWWGSAERVSVYAPATNCQSKIFRA